MAPLLFTNAALLGGLFALGIPILIHLLMRRKRIRQRFSSIQFFLKRDEKAGHRQKLRQWLLLATRLALLALLVLAFARPYQESNVATNELQQRQNIVFILDRSASMLATDRGVSRWDKAKETIQSTLDGLTFKDQVALVECASPSTTLCPLMPPVKLKAELEKLGPGYGEGDLGDALREATKVLSTKNLPGKSSIYVISDLQRQSGRKLAAAPVPRQFELKVFPIGEAELSNRAILDLKDSINGSRSLSAEVAEFSLSPSPIKLDWLIDGTRKSALSKRVGTNTTFLLPDLAPGWHQIAAQLESDDHFPSDNVRYQAMKVPVPLKTLSVEGRSTANRFEEESFFVNSALEPGSSLTNTLSTFFKIDKIAVAEAGAVLSNRERLFQYQLVLLPALRNIPAEAAKVMSDYVNQGGAIVFWTGDNINPNHYNSALGKLIPATLKQSEGGVLQLESGWHLGEVDFNSPVFSIFHQPSSGDVTLPEFSHRFALETAATAQVLARFSDNTPFLIVQNLGQGRVALVNTSVDTAWSDWPKRKTFVPWIHSLCHYLTRTEGDSGLHLEKPFVANSLAQIETDRSFAGKSFRVRAPKGDEYSLVANDQGTLSARLTMPGVYTVSNPEGRLLKLLSVNLPKSESDLSTMTEADFESQIVRCDAAQQSGVAAELFYSGKGTRDFWRLLLLCAAGLLFLESALANRTFA